MVQLAIANQVHDGMLVPGFPDSRVPELMFAQLFGRGFSGEDVRPNLGPGRQSIVLVCPLELASTIEVDN